MPADSEAHSGYDADTAGMTSMHLRTLDQVVSDAADALGLTEQFDAVSRYTDLLCTMHMNGGRNSQTITFSSEAYL